MKKKNILLLVIIVGILLILSGLTYGYLRVTKTLDKEQVGTLTCLSISLSDSTDEITLTNAYAITDAEGYTLTP